MKNNFISLYISFLLTVCLSSCSQDDILVDNTGVNEKFLLQISSHTLKDTSLKIFNVVDGSLPLIDLNLDCEIDSVRLIKNFRGNYFVFSGHRIIIINNDAIMSFLDGAIGTISTRIIDFTDIGIVPQSICFPNATDAYITFVGSKEIRILDLTNFTLPSLLISIGHGSINSYAGNIAGYGNQVYVLSPGNNLVYIIDTRYNTVVDSIKIKNTPKFIEFTNNGQYCVIVSDKEPCLSVIEVATRKIHTERNILNNDETNSSITPTSLSMSNNFVYVSCIKESNNMGAGCVRISTSNFRTSTIVSTNSCDFVYYSPKYNSLVIGERNQQQFINDLIAFKIINQQSNKLKHSQSIPAKITAISD